MIAVTTTQRPVDYVSATLGAICAQRPRSRCVLVSDGPCSIRPPNGWDLAVLPRRGQWHAMAHAWQLAAESGEDLVQFEDDIEIAIGAVPYMEDFAVPADVSVVQFCGIHSMPGSPPRLTRDHIRSMAWMWQGLKFPARTLRRLLRHPYAGNATSSEFYWALDGVGFLGVHQPELVRHVGEVSVIAPNRPASEMPRGHNFLAPPLTVEHLKSAIQGGFYR